MCSMTDHGLRGREAVDQPGRWAICNSHLGRPIYIPIRDIPVSELKRFPIAAVVRVKPRD